jgi:uncharacterized protein YukE
MAIHDNLDEFLDENAFKQTKDKLHQLLVTDLKSKIDEGKTETLATLKDAWEGDDYEAYASMIDATVNKCNSALDTLGREIDQFIEDQISEWKERESRRIESINSLK